MAEPAKQSDDTHSPIAAVPHSNSFALRAFRLALAFISLVLGLIGIVVPGLPTTPFVLLAAFAATRSSPRLHQWLQRHALFGPMIGDWQREGAVSQRAKVVASVTMALCSVILFATAPHWWLAVVGSGWMLVVAIWLWRRPLPDGKEG